MRRCPDIEQLRSTILISWITSEDREMLIARDSRRDTLTMITLFQLRVTSLFRKISKIRNPRSSLTSVLIFLIENCDVIVIASAFVRYLEIPSNFQKKKKKEHFLKMSKDVFQKYPYSANRRLLNPSN